MRSWTVLFLLAACDYTKSDWKADRDEALCDVLVACFGAYADASACRSAQRRDPEGPCGGFRPARARVCVDRLRDEAKACPTTELTDWQIPIECADVCIYPRVDTGG